MERSSSLGVLILVVLAATLAFGSDPPASKLNPQSGHTEIVDLVGSAGQHQVRHTTDDGSNRPPTYAVTSSSPDNLRPRIAISEAGHTWVVWYRDGEPDQVLARKRNYTTGTWSAERVLSATSEDSRLPFVAHDGNDAWVAFEFTSGGDSTIAVNVVVDEPDPIQARTVIATTDYTGDLDVQIHHESGHLWTTWVDSSSDVGWSVYDYQGETWSSPAYESYASETVDDARERIRTEILGN